LQPRRSLIFNRRGGTQQLVETANDAAACRELSNSAATSVMTSGAGSALESMGLNTVLVPAQWDLIEQEEGKFTLH
jgi:hypothetical protein